MEQKAVALIKNMVGQMLIDSVSDDDEVQLVKIVPDINATPDDGDDIQSGVERIQEYGITSNPPRGSETVVLYSGGKKESGIVIKVDSAEYRIQGLKTGELCVYSQHGQKILLKDDGDIVFNDGNDNAVRFSDLKNGFDNLKTDFNNLVSIFNTHIHNVAALPSVGTPPPTIPTLTTPTTGTSTTASVDGAKIEEIKLP